LIRELYIGLGVTELTHIDKSRFDELLVMESGYGLHFSDRFSKDRMPSPGRTLPRLKRSSTGHHEACPCKLASGAIAQGLGSLD